MLHVPAVKPDVVGGVPNLQWLSDGGAGFSGEDGGGGAGLRLSLGVQPGFTVSQHYKSELTPERSTSLPDRGVRAFYGRRKADFEIAMALGGSRSFWR